MKRAASIYLLVLGGVNGAIGWGSGLLASGLRSAYTDLLGPEGLPAITVYALRLPPAFYLLAGAAVGLAALTWDRVSVGPWGHGCAALIALEILLLVFVGLGFVMPFFTLTIKI